MKGHVLATLMPAAQAALHVDGGGFPRGLTTANFCSCFWRRYLLMRHAAAGIRAGSAPPGQEPFAPGEGWKRTGVSLEAPKSRHIIRSPRANPARLNMG